MYEEALRGVLKSWRGGRLDTSRGSARVVDPSGNKLSSSRVKPDYRMTTTAGAYCWGYNGHSQLGEGTTITSLTPVPVVQ